MRALPLMLALAVATVLVVALWPKSPTPVCAYYAGAVSQGKAAGTVTDAEIAAYEKACGRQ